MKRIDKQLKDSKDVSYFMYKAVKYSNLDMRVDDLIWTLDENQKQSAIVPLNLEGTSYIEVSEKGVVLYSEDNIEGKEIEIDAKQLGIAIKNTALKMNNDEKRRNTILEEAQKLEECIKDNDVNYNRLNTILENLDDKKILVEIQGKNEQQITELVSKQINNMREKADSIGLEKIDSLDIDNKYVNGKYSPTILKTVCKDAKEKLLCVDELVKAGKQIEEIEDKKTIFNCAKTVLTHRIKGWKEKINELKDKIGNILEKHGNKIIIASTLVAMVCAPEHTCGLPVPEPTEPTIVENSNIYYEEEKTVQLFGTEELCGLPSQDFQEPIIVEKPAPRYEGNDEPIQLFPTEEKSYIEELHSNPHWEKINKQRENAINAMEINIKHTEELLKEYKEIDVLKEEIQNLNTKKGTNWQNDRKIDQAIKQRENDINEIENYKKEITIWSENKVKYENCDPEVMKTIVDRVEKANQKQNRLTVGEIARETSDSIKNLEGKIEKVEVREKERSM